ncbi:AI-2E family transporter [Pseudonocardia sp. TMWB2A]|uniref:AI-2E family transporter n=1 Tax=Pseudonocardia sp. TMWB2A TaxID=687430 RepID=UPI00307D850F
MQNDKSATNAMLKSFRRSLTKWRVQEFTNVMTSSGPPEQSENGAPRENGGRGRDRLLASIALTSAVLVFLALPFALRAGAEFFLPLTAALVIAIALVPALEWLERRGFPSMIASAICVILFLILVNGALAVIIVPATDWFIELPDRLPKIQATLSPLIDFYANLQRFVDRILQSVASGTSAQARAVAIEAPRSLLDFIAGSAPAAAIQIFFAILAVFFFLAGWTRLRKRTINNRENFDTALETARVIQNVVNSTSSYLTTITIINALLGAAVALILWMLGMPSPLMWGGIVALFNFVPYLGPILGIMLLALGGLMSFDRIELAILPALVYFALHTIEANIVTPMILGRRLTINPLLILVSLSFWGWVWGTPGALLAVPILIILQTVLKATGTPDLAGFLFESGTLTHDDEA